MDQTQYMWLGIILVIVITGGVIAWRHFRTVRRQRRAVIQSLRDLGQRIALEEAQMKPYPAPALGGYLNGYPVTIVCRREGGEWAWRLQTELESNWAGRILFHGEDRPSKMRELYGMEIVLTGDQQFDRHVVVAATDEQVALKLLGKYLRQRFYKIGHSHYQIDIRGKVVIAEFRSTKGGRGAQVPAYLYLVNTLCAMLDMVVQSHPER